MRDDIPSSDNHANSVWPKQTPDTASNELKWWEGGLRGGQPTAEDLEHARALPREAMLLARELGRSHEVLSSSVTTQKMFGVQGAGESCSPTGQGGVITAEL